MGYLCGSKAVLHNIVGLEKVRLGIDIHLVKDMIWNVVLIEHHQRIFEAWASDELSSRRPLKVVGVHEQEKGAHDMFDGLNWVGLGLELSNLVSVKCGNGLL